MEAFPLVEWMVLSVASNMPELVFSVLLSLEMLSEVSHFWFSQTSNLAALAVRISYSSCNKRCVLWILDTEGLHISPRAMTEWSAVKVSCMYASLFFLIDLQPFLLSSTHISLQLCWSYSEGDLGQMLGKRKEAFFCVAVCSWALSTLSSFWRLTCISSI